MKALIKLEIKKSLFDWLFIGSLMVGILLVSMSSIHVLHNYFNYIEIVEDTEISQMSSDPTAQYSLYNSWVGGESFTLGHTLFYLLLPLLATLPVGWNFSEEVHTKYLRVVVHRCGRKKYFLSKLCVAFITGGITVTLPQILNFSFIALFIPATKPRVIYLMYYLIEHASCISELYYSAPLLCFFIIMLMDFIFGGLISCLSLSAAFFFQQRIAAVIVPYLVLLGTDYMKSFLYYISYYEVSLLNILHPMSPFNILKWTAVLVWIIVLSAIGLIVVLGKGCRNEIF
jgi:hypothetical protein